VQQSMGAAVCADRSLLYGVLVTNKVKYFYAKPPSGAVYAAHADDLLPVEVHSHTSGIDLYQLQVSTTIQRKRRKRRSHGAKRGLTFRDIKHWYKSTVVKSETWPK
jgi:hypothetical protein